MIWGVPDCEMRIVVGGKLRVNLILPFLKEVPTLFLFGIDKVVSGVTLLAQILTLQIAMCSSLFAPSFP